MLSTYLLVYLVICFYMVIRVILVANGSKKFCLAIQYPIGYHYGVITTSKKLIDYETTNGDCPIREWLDDLDNAITARIEARLKRVALGNLGDVKPVGQGVSELRLTFGSGYRVYFAQHGEKIIILLCGGDKGSQNDDIETAKNYWLDFKRRNNA